MLDAAHQSPYQTPGLQHNDTNQNTTPLVEKPKKRTPKRHLNDFLHFCLGIFIFLCVFVYEEREKQQQQQQLIISMESVPPSPPLPGFSIPIRAPPTIDSDSEYSDGQISNSSTSSSYSSDNGFESEGFVSGEDEFETASDETLEQSSVVQERVASRPFVKYPDEEIAEGSYQAEKMTVSRPFVKYPDKEIVGGSHQAEKFNVSRPFVTYPDEEIVGGSHHVEKFTGSRLFVKNPDEDIVGGSHHVFRPFVKNPDGEIIEENEHIEELVDCRPFVESSDEEIVGKSDQVDEFYVSRLFVNDAAVVDIGILPLPKQPMPIALLSGYSDDDSVGSEIVEDHGFSGPVRVPSSGFPGLDTVPKVKVSVPEEWEEDESQQQSVWGEVLDEGLNSDEDKNVTIAKDFGTDVTEAAEMVSSLVRKEYFSHENSDGRGDVKYSDELNESSAAEKNRMDLGENVTLIIDSPAQREILVDTVEDKKVVKDSAVVESEIDTVNLVIKYPVESASYEAYNVVVHEMGMEANAVREEEDKSDSKINKRKEVITQTGNVDIDPDPTNCVNEETTCLKLIGVTNILEQSFPLIDVDKNVNFGAVPVDKQDSKNYDANITQRVIVNPGIDDEKLQIKTHLETEGVVESKFASVIGGNEKCIAECTKISETYATWDIKFLGLSHSPNISSGLQLKVEDEEAAYCDPDNLLEDEEGEVYNADSDTDSDGFIFEESGKAKQVIGKLDQRFNPAFLMKVVSDTDEEVNPDKPSEGKELLDRAALTACLEAATGTVSDGGGFMFTPANVSRVFSLDGPAGIDSKFHPSRSTSQPNCPNVFTSSELVACCNAEEMMVEEEKELEKIQQLRVKLLRLVHRLGRSAEDSLAAQCLFQLKLASESACSHAVRLESAKSISMEIESEGKNDLNFSLNILVIGKTGVGKSATINSIFGAEKTTVDAFKPATTAVKEVVGMLDGVKVRVLDTPGLRSSLAEQSFNQKVLSSIKKFTKKFPPDVILYIDRVDTITRDPNDLRLLRSITSSLGSAVWRNAVVILTHASFIPPEEPYEYFTAQQSRYIQQLISHAVGDMHLRNSGLMIPVCLVENHPLCKKNRNGQTVLPNGETWRSQLLLLCYSIKIISEANTLMKKTQVPSSLSKLFGFRPHFSPLPHFLYSLLQPNAHPELSADQGIVNVDPNSEVYLSEIEQEEDEDEYDQLPPFKPLRKSHIAKLSKEQRKAYFEEYDYRVKLLQKQWREEVERLREVKKKGKDAGNDYSCMEEEEEVEAHENGAPASTPVPVPDRELPLSFDGDDPSYRFPCSETTSQFLVMPVLVQGWDHDLGYDGVILEENLAIAGQFPAAIAVQITKDKREFNIHMVSSVSAKHGGNGSTMAGLDIQTLGKQRAYILKGETEMEILKINRTAAGVSIAFAGENAMTGLKLGHQIAIGKRFGLVANCGATKLQGEAAYGAIVEAQLRGKDFSIGNDQTTLRLSLVKWRDTFAFGCNLQSRFSVGRRCKMSLRAELNNNLSRQISVRTCSSDQLQIALVGLLPLAGAIFRKMFPQSSEAY